MSTGYIPAFATCMQDPATAGHPRAVYIWFHERLDVQSFRPVKHAAIETELAIEDSSVAAAIRRLCDLGYLYRGARVGKVWSYRLVYTNPRRASSALHPAKLEHQSA